MFQSAAWWGGVAYKPLQGAWPDGVVVALAALLQPPMQRVGQVFLLQPNLLTRINRHVTLVRIVLLRPCRRGPLESDFGTGAGSPAGSVWVAPTPPSSETSRSVEYFVA